MFGHLMSVSRRDHESNFPRYNEFVIMSVCLDANTPSIIQR